MKELHPNRRSKKLLDDFFVFDTETGDTLKNGNIKWKLDARPESFIFGCVYGKDYKRTITTVREFQSEFQHPRYKGKKVFAHNAEYDLNCIFGNIYQFDNEAVFNGRFISASNGNCVFADSLNIYRASVADIGEKMGYPKMVLGDKKGDLISKGGYTQKDVEYCYRDCEIIWFALLKIFEDAGTPKLTQASLSLNYFRTRFLKRSIQHNENCQIFWDSYFGGRCEAFYIGEVQAKVIDINRTYSAVMAEIDFPDPSKICFELTPSLSRVKQIMKSYEGCVHCDVIHHESWIGYLPVKRDKKLIFPIGNFSGCWNFNELSFAVQSGVVELKKVHQITYAPVMENPFKEHATTLWNEWNKSTDQLERERLKTFALSLYGKFGSRVKEKNIYLEDWRSNAKMIKDYMKSGLFIDLILFNGERLDAFLVVKSNMDLGQNAMNYSIPSFASLTTSGARVKLLKKGIELHDKGLNPIYCDTDSWFYNSTAELPNETFLGGWKTEHKTVTHIHGLKNYEFTDLKTGEKQRKLKGVPKKAENLGENRFRFISMVRTKESLRRNIDAGIFEVKEKKLNLKYDKRIVLKDGNTKPFDL